MRVWTQEQELLLLYYKEREQLSWPEIARKLPDFTMAACERHYQKIKTKSKRKLTALQGKPWTDEHDAKLLELATRVDLNWAERGNILQRSAGSCEQRYYILRDRSKGCFNNKDRVAGEGPPVGDTCAITVPVGDPLLARLIKEHGKDNINRNFRP